VCTYILQSNSFVDVVVVFHVAIKLPHFRNGAGVGPTFELCVSAKVLLPVVGKYPVWISDGLSGIILQLTTQQAPQMSTFSNLTLTETAYQMYQKFVCPDHCCFFFCFLPLPRLFHPLLFFVVVLIDTSSTSASVSVCNS